MSYLKAKHEMETGLKHARPGAPILAVLLIAAIWGGPVQAQEGCGEPFLDALAACEPASCRFAHPMTGEPMEQQVVGLDSAGERCRYTQQMPQGGMMECAFTKDDRQTMAAFFRRLAEAETVGTSASTDLQTGETATSHRIDGNAAANPLAEAMAGGRCQISGYGEQ